jgi:hypothetical protein
MPPPPPWFNVVLSERSIKILEHSLSGRKRELDSERFMVEVSPPLASAPWN